MVINFKKYLVFLFYFTVILHDLVCCCESDNIYVVLFINAFKINTRKSFDWGQIIVSQKISFNSKST